MRDERGWSVDTIRGFCHTAGRFFDWLDERCNIALASVSRRRCPRSDVVPVACVAPRALLVRAHDLMRWTRRLPLQPGRACAARRCRSSILRISSPSSPICGRGCRRAIGPRSRWRRSSIWSGPRTGRRAGARWRRCPGGSTARRGRPSRPTRRPPSDFRGPSDGFVSSGREFPCRPHLRAPAPRPVAVLGPA